MGGNLKLPHSPLFPPPFPFISIFLKKYLSLYLLNKHLCSV